MAAMIGANAWRMGFLVAFVAMVYSGREFAGPPGELQAPQLDADAAADEEAFVLFQTPLRKVGALNVLEPTPAPVEQLADDPKSSTGIATGPWGFDLTGMRDAVERLGSTAGPAARRRARDVYGHADGDRPTQTSIPLDHRSPWSQLSALSEQAAHAGCKMLDANLEERCNNVAGKDPAVPNIADDAVKMKGLAVEGYEGDPGAFERRLGRALAHTPVVRNATEEFGRRLFKVIVGDLNGTTRTQRITDAFAAKCSKHNTGFFTHDPVKIEERLTQNPGNIREMWGLVYCLTKNKPVLSKAMDALTKEDMEERLGKPAGTRAWEALLERRGQIRATSELPEEHRFSWGIVDYIYPPLNNWVRFTFELKDSASNTTLWRGARNWKGHCDESNFTSDSPEIDPPLSPDELAAVCGSLPSCKLPWYPGIGCYTLNEDNIYMKAARSLGYRVATGPSGTTTDVLQLGLLLGFTKEDLLAFRTAMLAWMLPADDHSYVEIMLGANTFMLPKYKMQMEHVDFNQLWPARACLKTSWGATYSADEVWTEVKKLFPDWK